MIVLPRPAVLAGSMLVGTAVGLLVGVAAILVVDVRIRPDLVIGFIVGIPSALGLLIILVSGQRWVTALGAFLLATAPGWLTAMVAIQAVNSA